MTESTYVRTYSSTDCTGRVGETIKRKEGCLRRVLLNPHLLHRTFTIWLEEERNREEEEKEKRRQLEEEKEEKRRLLEDDRRREDEERETRRQERQLRKLELEADLLKQKEAIEAAERA